MVKKKRISLIIPARNEEKGIAKLIKSLPKLIDEVIVIDNGSTDNTCRVAKKAGAKVIKENKTLNGIGYGYAHMKGIEVASGDFIVAMDGDDTYPSQDIEDIVLRMMSDSIDYVSCNRLPLVNKKAISKTRQLGIRVLNLVILLIYGYPIQDMLSGMWVFKREVKDKLNLKMGDWNLSPEIKINAIVDPRIKFAEYHIDHFNRTGKSEQIIWKTGFKHLFYIFKKRFTEDLQYIPLANLLKGYLRFEGVSIQLAKA